MATEGQDPSIEADRHNEQLHEQSMMGSRGVSRPMAEAEMRGGRQGHDGGSHETDDGDHGHSHEHGMSHDDRMTMLTMHHKQTLWVYWTLPLLGIWMMLAPFNFGYLNESLWVDPSGGRGPWFAEQSTPELRELRAWMMTLSDVTSGLLLIIFGWRSLRSNRPYSLWACCFVGVWLTFAPVLFWAPTAVAMRMIRSLAFL